MNITDQSDEDVALESLQKVLRRLSVYNDLLLNLKNSIYTPADPDYNDLLQAIKKIDDAASHIEFTNRNRENKESLLRIGKSFDPPIDLLVKDRKFIRSGSLTKVCRRANKDFYFSYSTMFCYMVTGKVRMGKLGSIGR